MLDKVLKMDEDVCYTILEVIYTRASCKYLEDPVIHYM